MRLLIRGYINKEKDFGFTFLEVMVAVALLAITLTAALGSQSQSVSLASEAKFYTTVTLLAQGKMAEIEAKDLDTLSSESGDFGEDFPGYTWEVTVENVSLDYPENVSNHLRQVTLTLSWEESEHYQYSLKTYRFSPKGK
jgi:general secretion pathway protein I